MTEKQECPKCGAVGGRHPGNLVMYWRCGSFKTSDEGSEMYQSPTCHLAALTAENQSLQAQLAEAREAAGEREREPSLKPIAIPDEPGWYLTRGVVPFERPGSFTMLKVRRPFWTDASRKDLEWYYPDNSGGDDYERYRVDMGGEWFKVVIPAALAQPQAQEGKP